MGKLPVTWPELLSSASQPGASESELEYWAWAWVSLAFKGKRSKCWFSLPGFLRHELWTTLALGLWGIMDGGPG